jgi:flagellar biosynthetic protein FliR
MEQLISLIDQPTVLAFILLFARVLAFTVFMPIFNHKTVNSTIRVSIAFFLSIFLFPLVENNKVYLDDSELAIAIISELILGLVASIFVQVIFYAVQIIGDLIGYATALSMANMFDPATGTQQGIISRLLYMILLVVYLESGMYEVTIYMLAESFGTISLGTFNLYDYNGIMMAIDEIKVMFAFAMSFAFPLFFIGFILDVYYAYGTKSMPAFSPFIVTFQIKFALIFIFLMLGFDVFVNNITEYFITKLQ